MGIGAAIGMGAGILGSGIQGYAQNKENKKVQQQQQQHYDQLSGLVNQQLQSNAQPSQWQQQLLAAMGSGQIGHQDTIDKAPTYDPALAGISLAGPASYSAQGYTPGQSQFTGYNAATTDIPSFLTPFASEGAAQAAAGQSSVGGFTAKEIQAALAGGPLSVGAERIDIPTLQQLIGSNMGNDALMQLLRSDPSKQVGAADSQLQQMLATGNPYNTSDLFSATQGMNDINYRRGLAAAQNTGSLGARFGSAGQQRAARTAGDLTTAMNLQNSQTAMAAHEAAAARQMQAAQLLGALESSRRGDYLQAALGAGNLGQSQAGTLLQAAQANQATGLEAQRLNQAAQLQTALANQAAQNNIGLANQGAYNSAGMQTQNLQAQSSMSNAQLATQAAIANAASQNAQKMALLQAALGLQGQNVGALNTAGQFNAGAFNTNSMFNTGQGNAALQFGAEAQNSANAGNAQLLQQSNLFNAGAQNQQAQFNTGQQNAANQFNIGSQFNTTQLNNAAYAQQQQALLQALGLGAGMQQGQNSYNAQLLGILGGLQPPAANPSAGWFGEMLQNAGGFGMLAGQLMGGGGAPTGSMAGAAQYQAAPIPANLLGGQMPSYFPNSPFNSPFGTQPIRYF